MKADLNKFKALGMEVVGAKYTRTASNCVLKINLDTKKAYFKMPLTDAEIIFDTKPFKAKFVLDPKTNRLYIVEVDGDCSDALVLSNGATENFVRSNSTGLYELLAKHKYSALAEAQVQYDSRLNAYYVVVK